MKLGRASRVALSVTLMLGSFAALAPVASAANCPATNLDGKTIGQIVFGASVVQVKSVTYPVSGSLNPPRSPLYAGLSARHNPLNATEGSSLIVWHINYEGCIGTLNPIISAKIGTNFAVVDENGKKKSYKISKSFSVPVGNYQSDWFRLDGSRQLIFVTCGGKVVNGHYTRNEIVISIPA